MKKLTASQNKLILETDKRLRSLERAHKTNPEDIGPKTAYRNELRRLLDMQQVEAVRCLGIYKAYKHGADSPNMFFVGSKELADIATTMLDENDGGIHYIEGGEWSAWWDSKPAIAELDDVLLTSDEVYRAMMEVREE
jgi:hypothetical protein